MEKLVIDYLPKLNNVNNFSDAEIVELYRKMLTIRFTEQRIAQRVSERKIYTPCHLYIGQEAVAVGACSALNDDDYVFSTHRSHGHFLAKSGNLKGLFCEIYCRETGCSGGRGGSMHLCDPQKGLLGSSSIVAGTLGIGTGPALKSKVMGLDNVSVIFHGDCVPEEGIWHESLNFSAINRLPVIYICENNLYAASSALEDRRILDNIHKLAHEHGLSSEVVDGNDVFAVNDAVRKAVGRARNGEGPQFIEARTYRWLGHVGPRDDIDVGLRDKDELEYWKTRCPIKNLGEYISKNIANGSEIISDISKEVQMAVDEAEAYAVSCKKPDGSTLYNNLYKEEC